MHWAKQKLMVQNKVPGQGIVYLPFICRWAQAMDQQKRSPGNLGVPSNPAAVGRDLSWHTCTQAPIWMSVRAVNCPDEGTPTLHPAPAPPRYITPMTGTGIGRSQWGPQANTIRVSVPADIHAGCHSSWQVASLGCFVVANLG